MSEGMQDLSRAIVRTMSDYQPGEHTVMYGETRSEPKRIPVSDPDPATTPPTEDAASHPQWCEPERSCAQLVEAAYADGCREGREAERQRIRDGIERIPGWPAIPLRIQRAVTDLLGGDQDA